MREEESEMAQDEKRRERQRQTKRVRGVKELQNENEKGRVQKTKIHYSA